MSHVPPVDGSTQELGRLVIRRQAIGRVWAEQLSHGLDATGAREAITRVEREIQALDPGYYRSGAPYWAQRDAAQLHRPWEALPGCRGCTGIVLLRETDLLACGNAADLCLLDPTPDGHDQQARRGTPADGPDGLSADLACDWGCCS